MEERPPHRQRKRFSPQPVQSGFRTNRPPNELDSEGTSSPASNAAESSTSPPYGRQSQSSTKTDPSSSGTIEPSQTKLDHQPPPMCLLPEDKAAPAPPKARRRFTPQPVEKTKRQKRSDSIGLIMLPEDRTDVSTLNGQSIDHGSLQVARSFVAKKRPVRKGHSFTIPSLKTIRSLSDSEPENPANPSPPSLSYSPTTGSDDTMHTSTGRSRPRANHDAPKPTSSENEDDSFEGYIRALAAVSSERQYGYQDGMDAVYVNSEVHEPVRHYDIGDESPPPETATPRPNRRRPDKVPISEREDSYAEAALDMQMRLPEINEPEETIARKRTQEGSRWDGPFGGSTFGQDLKAALGTSVARSRREDLELEAMRTAAKAPLAGGDLQFVRCASPIPTRLVVEHDARTLHQNRAVGGGGLWGGYCVDRSAATTPQSSNLAGAKLHGAALDDRNVCELASKKAATAAEQNRKLTDAEIEAEFTDEFCTQVYNYLSLGYPCMARPYDQELSRIAEVEIQSLRTGDWDPATEEFDPTGRSRGRALRMRGYVGLPEGHSADNHHLHHHHHHYGHGHDHNGVNGRTNGVAGRKSSKLSADIWAQIEEDEAEEEEAVAGEEAGRVQGEADPRWQALKKYVHWWAHRLGRSGDTQHSFGVGRSPEKVDGTVGGDRRGSWGQ